VVALYAIIRVDKRFHVPNGSHGPGDYSAGAQVERKPSLVDRVLSEEEVFDGELQRDETDDKVAERREKDIETGNSVDSATKLPEGH